MSNQVTTHFTIDTEQEEDGCWIAEILELPNVLVYGASPRDHRVALQFEDRQPPFC
jgi:predicted RNase H-like HicB family nuclease